MYKSIAIEELSAADVQNFLQHAIVPRPICFASTIDSKGNINLSPFSFFNLFSSNPPMVVFSPCRRVRDNSTKHTLENINEVPEVVVNIVSYDMVQQTSLSSCEFPKGDNEFLKAGFTMLDSLSIKPPRVKESPVQLECIVDRVLSLGSEGGAGNLVLAKVIMIHISDSILNQNGFIDQQKMDVVARLGANWYARINKDNIFEVEKPNLRLGIGFDNLPENIRKSSILSGNDLGRLANVDNYPLIDPSYADDKLKNIFQYYSLDPDEMEKELHIYAKELIAKNCINEAWQVLLAL